MVLFACGLFERKKKERKKERKKEERDLGEKERSTKEIRYLTTEKKRRKKLKMGTFEYLFYKEEVKV